MRQLTFLLLLVLSLTAAFAEILTGKVVAPDGQPVAGATVVIYATSSPAQVETDQAGCFSKEIDVPPADVQQGKYLACAAYKPGFAPGEWTGQLGKECVIRLHEAGEISGSVVDEAGAPVPGVPIFVYGMQTTDNWLSIASVMKERYSARTDANGRWTIGDVVKQGSVSIRLNDRKYVLEHRLVQVGNNAEPAKPIVAVPAATITGRCLTPEHKPAEGIRIMARGKVDGTITRRDANTAADGTFTLVSLPAATYDFISDDAGKKWITPPLKSLTVLKGEEKTLGDILLEPGAIIEGVVTETETGKPVPQVMLACQSTEEHGEDYSYFVPQSVSDKDGKYRFCVRPGKQNIYLIVPVTGFTRRVADVETVMGKVGETTTVNFPMSRGATVAGIMVDEQGKPAANVKLELHILCGQCGTEGCSNDDKTLLTGDADGKFTVRGLQPGKAIFMPPFTYGDNEADETKWDVTKQEPVTLPVTEPVRVMLRHLEMRTLTGKVVDRKGNPLAGVRVDYVARVMRGSVGYVLTLFATTDETGNYRIEKRRPDTQFTLQRTTKDGYKLMQAGEVKEENGQFHATDIVLTSCNGTLAGKVVDAEGKPVAGATVVSLEGDAKTRAQTDATGAFTLMGLPEGDNNLLVLTPEKVGNWQGETGNKQVKITIDPIRRAAPHDTALFKELWASWQGLPNTRRERVVQQITSYDIDTAFTLASDNTLTLSPSCRELMIYDLVGTNPTRAVELGLVQLKLITTQREKFYISVTLGLAVVKENPEVAEFCYNIAKGLVDTNMNPVMQHDRFSQLILLAAKLKHDLDVKIIFEQLMKVTGGIDGGARMPGLAGTAAQINMEMAKEVWESVEGKQRQEAMGAAIRELAATNPVKAQEMLPQIKDTGYDYSVKERIVTTLARTDPKAAAAFAEQFPYLRDKLLAVTSATQPKEQALKTYRELFERRVAQGSFNEETIDVIGRVLLLDAQAGKELLANVKDKFTTGDGSWNQYLPMVTYYYHLVDPVESRIMLEMAYAAEKTKANNWELLQYHKAMTAMDIDRAFGMLADFSDADRAPQAMANIACYVLATEEQRLMRYMKRY